MKTSQSIQIQTLMKMASQLQEMATITADMAGGEALEGNISKSLACAGMTKDILNIREKIDELINFRMEQKNSPAVERVKK